MKVISAYEQQAINFANKYGVKLVIHGKEKKKYFNDQRLRDVYELTLIRKFPNGTTDAYSFTFGQSEAKSEHWKDRITGKTDCVYDTAYRKWNGGGNLIHIKGEEPTLYDVIACLTKSNPGDFEEFCYEYGYNPDSISDNETYKAIREEYYNILRLFHDCMEELQEIQ